jgi:hypothetical protein
MPWWRGHLGRVAIHAGKMPAPLGLCQSDFERFGSVMPAQAGIQNPCPSPWIPAFAGMTKPGAIHQVQICVCPHSRSAIQSPNSS